MTEKDSIRDIFDEASWGSNLYGMVIWAARKTVAMMDSHPFPEHVWYERIMIRDYCIYIAPSIGVYLKRGEERISLTSPSDELASFSDAMHAEIFKALFTAIFAWALDYKTESCPGTVSKPPPQKKVGFCIDMRGNDIHPPSCTQCVHCTYGWEDPSEFLKDMLAVRIA